MNGMDEWQRRTDSAMLQRQVIILAAANAELMMALEDIAKKRKMDATAAASMKAIATKALNAAGVRT